MLTFAGAVLACVEYECEVAASEVLDKIKELQEPNGLFRASRSKKSASLANTQLAVTVLAQLRTRLSSTSHQAVLDQIAESLVSVLPSGSEDSLCDATILAGISAISSKKLKGVSTRLSVVAENLLHSRFSSDWAVKAGVLESLRAVSAYKTQPLYVQLSPTTLPAGRDASLRVIVTDVFGLDESSFATVSFSILPAAGGAAVHQARTNQASELSIPSTALKLGLYSAVLSVDVEGKQKGVVVNLPLAVSQSSIKVSSVHAGVTNKTKASRSELLAVKTQGSASWRAASAEHNDTVHVHFSVDAVGNRSPEQLLLKFHHVESGFVAILAATESTVSDKVVKVVYSVALSAKSVTFRRRSGLYTVSILAGDTLVSEAVEWALGTVELSFPAKPTTILPLYKQSLLHESDTTLQPLPEFDHVMRPPAKRADDLSATVFTVLTLLPMLVFVVFILTQFSVDPVRLSSLSSWLFSLGVVITVLLYVAYWFGVKGVSFYQIIGFLAVLAPVLAVTGRGTVIQQNKKN